MVGVDQAGNVTVIKEGLSFTLDATAPTPTLLTTTSVNLGSAINLRSSELGNAYVINTTNSPTSLSSIPTDSKLIQSTSVISTTQTTTITMAGLQAGTYKLYVSDNYGNFSQASSNSFTVTEAFKLNQAYIKLPDGTKIPNNYEGYVNTSNGPVIAKMTWEFNAPFDIFESGYVINREGNNVNSSNDASSYTSNYEKVITKWGNGSSDWPFVLRVNGEGSK